MPAEKFTVSTITWARDRREEDLVYDSLSKLSSKNIHVIAVDGGSREEFLDKIKTLRNISIFRSSKEGLQNQILESLNKAQTSSKYVFYTESNKNDFFKNHLDEFLSEAAKIIDKDSNVGIILPSRTEESFSTYPVFQKKSESFLNMTLNELLDKKTVDFTYGPRVIASDLIRYIGQLPKDIGWGWMTYLLFIAKKLGKNIHAVDLNLSCPQNERENTPSEKLLRLRQLKNHIQATEEGLSFKP